MKYITFAVPCYNSQDYLERCVESLLPGGEDVEIILVNDGSTDRTGEIIDAYAEKYPAIVKPVHKKNGGHGSGVNKGIALAAGIYYKVVDSDDWLEKDAYAKLLQTVKTHVDAVAKNTAGRVGQSGAMGRGVQSVSSGVQPTQCTSLTGNGTEDWKDTGEDELLPDIYVVNYVYNHLDEGTSRQISYKNVLPEEKLCGWDEVGRFAVSQYLLMHALVFRTEILRKSGVVLPEHTFFVDNIIAYQPLPYVRKLYYLNVDLYQYYIGREDQSVNENMLMRRIDQYVYVMNYMLDCVDLKEVRANQPRLEKYMCHFCSIIMATVTVHLLLIGDEEALEKKKKLWAGVKERDEELYRRLHYRNIVSAAVCLPFRRGVIAGYRFVKRIYKFQ